MLVMFTAGVISAISLITGLIDAAWAPAVNTTLIIVLALVHAREANRRRQLERELDQTRHEARDAKLKVGATRRKDPSKPDSGARRRWDD
jgi:hypothetical protein